MHNSQNSASSKDSFASAVLAQAKLLNIAVLSNEPTNHEIQAISNSIVSKIEQKTNTKVREIPVFHKIKQERADYVLPLAAIRAIFARKEKNIYELTIQKADQFDIEYDANNINFISLFDKVEKFEQIITRAKEVGIDWKNFGYDIIAIEQEIEEIIAKENDYKKDAYLDFFATRGLAG